MKAKILIGYPLSEERLAALSKDFLAECIQHKENRYEQVLDVIEAYDGLFVMGHKADQRLMDKASKLKIIANYGVGYDNIDAIYAAKKGIAVSNTPNTTSGPTATFAMGLMIALMRKIPITDRWIRKGELPVWGSRKELGNSPEGKVLGILGMGRIGKALAKRALAFDMQIIYHNRNRLSNEVEQQYQASYVSFEELLKQADILSIHTPLNENTHHLIGARELALMQSTSFLINTSRGAVVDTNALIDTLNQGGIAGAGLDVFPEEPIVPEALLSMDQVVLTPHNGTGTFEARQAMFDEAFGNIVAFLKGDPMTSRVA